MRVFTPPLPIDHVLPQLAAALREGTAAVLVAPPGAGKTTRVPLVLADEPWARGRRILVLEPRRLAARAAAERMAATLGEQVGETVGLRVRFGSKVSRRTRIEVLTEGVFTRLILDHPELGGVAAVLLDEFHERSLDTDLGLALARDVQQALREDLRLLAMSATLDAAPVARLLGDAPVIESRGRAFPVETRYLGRDPRLPIERQVADAVARAVRSDPGSVLAFLPGAGEIRRAEALLRERLGDAAIDVVPLHGSLERAAQDHAIAPAPPGRRKVVLATSIAETSLTIEGVRIVVDCGLARVPRYEPDVGLTRLETVRVSRAAAGQRRGRAGRNEPGVCLRLWDEPQTASLEPYAKPAILDVDLSSFVLDLAQWGVADPGRLTFLDAPPQAALAEAQALLRRLGALDSAGRITDDGRKLRRLPLPPRLARMVVDAAEQGAGEAAAEIAAIVSERGLGGDDVDLAHRRDVFRSDRSLRAREARQMAGRWAKLAVECRKSGDAGPHHPTPGSLLAAAYPDRIARNRGGGAGAFLLANGRGGSVDPASPLARERYLAVAELTGTAAQGRIVLAAAITPEEIEARFADRIEIADETAFDPTTLSLHGRRTRRLGAISLSEQRRPVAANADTARMLADGAVRLGLDRLPWTRALTQWRERVLFLRALEGAEWPDLSDQALAAAAPTWLAPALAAATSLSELTPEALSAALQSRLPGTCGAGLPSRRRPTSMRRPGRAWRSTMRPRRARASLSACRSCSASPSIRRWPGAACR
jgi:ATP-dependent helicase HrpB